VWETAAKAVAEGNATEFCALVSAEGRREIATRTGGLGCETAVRLLASRLNTHDRDVIRTTEITQVEVQGDEAIVEYATTDALAEVGFRVARRGSGSTSAGCCAACDARSRRERGGREHRREVVGFVFQLHHLIAGLTPRRTSRCR
jgi:hypothetical protein